MSLSLKPSHLGRYRDLARLLAKYGRGDLVQASGLDAAIGDDAPRDDAAAAATADQLAADLEAMGPTYVKLGQLLSTRAELLPPAYLDALSRLQDRVEPFSFAEVERIIEGELGIRISTAFAELEATPMAAASLGQVHRAVLRDGRRVAVKVQRPGIRERMSEDFEVLTGFAELLDRRTDVGRRYGFAPMVDEFQKSLARELDYRSEANNLVTLGANLAEFDRLVVPQPIDDFTTSRVLTMQYVPGRKITDLGPLARLELDGTQLLDQLFRAYLKQILADGFFHADPHPGNVLVTDDGRLALIDLGMVAHLRPDMREQLLRLLVSLSEARIDEAAEISMRIGTQLDGFDEERFRREIGDVVMRHQGLSAADMQAGRVVMEISRVSGDSGLRPPPELTMLGKALLNLDQIARTLDPAFDPNQAIRDHVGEMTSRQLWRSASPGNAFTALLDTKEFVERLPARVNKIMDAVANNELRVRVDSIDEQRLLRGLTRVSNRVTTGIILAALIVGAAMLMRIETNSTLFGYPALAIVLFLVAAGLGLFLVVEMILDSRRHRSDD